MLKKIVLGVVALVVFLLDYVVVRELAIQAHPGLMKKWARARTTGIRDAFRNGTDWRARCGAALKLVEKTN